MSIYKEYYSLQEDLENKYDERCIVLMQVGKFYEAYGVDLPDAKPPVAIGHVRELGEILAMRVTYKSTKKKHSLSNPMMAGFPTYALGNHIAKLLQSGYVVAVYDQKTVKHGKKNVIERELIKIYNPTTYIDEDVGSTNVLMAIGFDNYICPMSSVHVDLVRYASINLVTGGISLGEIYNTAEDNSHVDTELYRVIHTFNPSEILCSGTNVNSAIVRYDLESYSVREVELNGEYRSFAYQDTFLRKVYDCGAEMAGSAVEVLGLERNSDLVPYLIQVLQYAYDHDPLIITKVQEPNIVGEDDQLILNNDSIYQLHLIELPGAATGRFSSLYKTINFTRTAMGRALLRSRLLEPAVDAEVINNRYDQIDAMADWYEECAGKLRDIVNINVKYRKMVSGKLHPYELASLCKSLRIAQEVMSDIDECFNIDDCLVDEIDDFLAEYDNIFNEEILATSRLGQATESYFNIGYSHELDEIQETITKNSALLDEIVDVLAKEISGRGDTKVKLNFTAASGHHLAITAKRFADIPKDWSAELEDGTIVSRSDFITTKLKSTVKITFPALDQISRKLVSAQEKLGGAINDEYISVIREWGEEWADTICDAACAIGQIDVAASAARAAADYGYVRPNIDSEADRAYLDAAGLRHPIIERICSTRYIANDVSVGKDGNCGIILYGVNMSGKSSLLRSIGVAVVMAQAGLFVSAKSLTISPFKSVISKITVQDKPLKGQSLFMVEMKEVNNMLRHADEWSLVLSDELCSSTESSSAHPLVAATLSNLAKRDVGFVFSTHIHEMQKLPQIAENSKIRIMHFAVTIQNGEMIFNRELRPGGINDAYGIEIAQALGLPSDFIRDAYAIRAVLRPGTGEILSTKRSNYNCDVYMHECAKCGSREQLETHHILHQCTANSRGLIDGSVQKNQKFNLLVVCRNCHMQIHSGKLSCELSVGKIELW